MRAPGRTLRARIVWTTAIVSAIAVTAMIGTVLLVLNASATNSINTTLADRLAVVKASLTTSPSGSLTERETPSDDIDDTTWIFDVDGNQVDAPRAGTRVQAKAESLAKVRKRVKVESHDRVYLATPVRDRSSGKVSAVVVVTESQAPYETTRIAVLAVLGALGLAVTGGAAAIAAWTVRRTLVPVESMAERAEDWSERDLDARFEDTGTEDEFAVLGRTLNLLLDRVAGALRNEQQLTAELAHELRTPLTAIRGEAELAMMGQPDAASAERFNRVVALSDRMSTTISSLLAIARGSAGSAARTTVSSLVSAALDDRPPHPDITVSADQVTDDVISAPVDLALRALSPLVDNAFRHARTTVAFTVATHARSVDITVSDDGEGVTEAESLFTGQRGAASGGTGLGLALSLRVARSLGGDVHLTSPAAPTSFTLTLPRY
jgi:two-component system OmpR family sensor kinase